MQDRYAESKTYRFGSGGGGPLGGLLGNAGGGPGGGPLGGLPDTWGGPGGGPEGGLLGSGGGGARFGAGGSLVGVPGVVLLPLSDDTWRGGRIGFGEFSAEGGDEGSSSSDPFVQALEHSKSGSNPSGYSRLFAWLESVKSLDFSSPEVEAGAEVRIPTRLPVDDDIGKSEAIGVVTPKMSEKPPRSCSGSGASGNWGSSTGSADGGIGLVGGGTGLPGGSARRFGGSFGRA